MQEDLIAEAEIGDEAKRFKESDIGRVLLGIAQQELLEAQEALESVDPTKTEEIRALQNKATTARNFDKWLGELVDKGEAAISLWRQNNEQSEG